MRISDWSSDVCSSDLDISTEMAAAVLLKGTTAEFLIERCARIQSGQTAFVHAAAGGVGLLLVQWLKAIGVHVLAHTGSEAKAAIVRKLGKIGRASCREGVSQYG